MYNISAYTFAPFKVVWKTMGNAIESVVLEPQEDSFIGSKSPIHKNTVISVSVENGDEAHYLCAALNSDLVNFVAKSSSVKGGKSFGSANLMEYVRIPRFDPTSPLHLRLAELSRQAHALAAQDLSGFRDLTGLEYEIDLAVAELWSVTAAELKEIRKSLEELG
jgi:hypothetical protein